MYYAISLSVSSLHRESIDSLIPALSSEVVNLTSNGKPTGQLPEMASHNDTVPFFSIMLYRFQSPVSQLQLWEQ